MTEEQLKKGKDAAERLHIASANLSHWEACIDSYNGRIQAKANKEKIHSNELYVALPPGAFDLLKMFSIDYYTKQVAAIKAEFETI